MGVYKNESQSLKLVFNPLCIVFMKNTQDIQNTLHNIIKAADQPNSNSPLPSDTMVTLPLFRKCPNSHSSWQTISTLSANTATQSTAVTKTTRNNP